MSRFDDPRFLAAVTLLLNAAFCAAMLLVMRSFGISFADMVAPDFGARAMVLFLMAVMAVAAGMAIAILSAKQICGSCRFGLLLVCLLVAAFGLKYASILLPAWLAPVWYLWRFARERGA